MNRSQARLGFKAPISEVEKNESEFTEEGIEQAMEKEFGGALNEEQQIPEDSTKIGTQDKLGKFKTQDNLVGGGVSTPELPQAKISLFYQEMAVYYDVRTQWNKNLPDASLHPVMALQLKSHILSVYMIIQDALKEDDKRLEEMNERIRGISAGCQQIGRFVVMAGGDDSSILLDPQTGPWYDNFLNYMVDTWAVLFEIISEVKLGLHFEKEKRWKKAIRGKHGDITRNISDKDAVYEEEVEKRVKYRLEQEKLAEMSKATKEAKPDGA